MPDCDPVKIEQCKAEITALRQEQSELYKQKIREVQDTMKAMSYKISAKQVELNELIAACN